jgi:hypothetical protein
MHHLSVYFCTILFKVVNAQSNLLIAVKDALDDLIKTIKVSNYTFIDKIIK